MSSSNMGGDGIATPTSARFADASPSPALPDKPELRLELTKGKFLSLGLIVIAFVISLPAWDAAYLLGDINYNFWLGFTFPTILIGVCFSLVILYICVVQVIFTHKNMPEEQSVQNFVMVLSLFLTLLALCFVLVSMPLSTQAVNAANDISYLCGSSMKTYELKEYYMQLLTLRMSDGCSDEYSVEECTGYEAVQPYTEYLKALEFQYHCSGFCYDAPAEAASLAALPPSPVPATAAEPSPQRKQDLAARKRSQHSHLHPPHLSSASSLVAVSARAAAASTATGQSERSSYPPLLFSSSPSKSLEEVSCDGAASRSLLFVSEDIGTTLWNSGLSLILISVVLGMTNWSAMIVK